MRRQTRTQLNLKRAKELRKQGLKMDDIAEIMAKEGFVNRSGTPVTKNNVHWMLNGTSMADGKWRKDKEETVAKPRKSKQNDALDLIELIAASNLADDRKVDAIRLLLR